MGHPALEGRGAVVTGAGRGIGAALARRLAAEGARVVVNDLDTAAAHAVAEEIGGRAAPGDCASEHGVAELLAEAEQALGRVDLFMANAGLAALDPDDNGLEASEESWARLHEVNVMAHVRAARALVPQWLSETRRGEARPGAPGTGHPSESAEGPGPRGRFVVTASAAGLLTMLGAAPYSVTKHAAVAFAEWLSASYGHRGVVVQAICPQGVDTRIYEQADELQPLLSHEGLLPPDAVAQAWVDSLDDDRFLVLPHPRVAEHYRTRAGETDRWLAGMRHLQQRLEAARSSDVEENA